MVLTVSKDSIPLSINSNGVILVGKTRVTLDTIVSIFKQGATPEEIASRYSSLKLADVYSAIAFYLNHQEEIETYLQQRQQQAQEIRKMNEARFDPQDLRNRLLARQSQKQVC
jgi:uncharacterized protein (DUF433 family)